MSRLCHINSLFIRLAIIDYDEELYLSLYNDQI